MKEYIRSLREKVGHETIIQCAASIIVIDEKVEDCALRELKEEFGLTADELEFFMINSGKDAHYI